MNERSEGTQSRAASRRSRSSPLQEAAPLLLAAVVVPAVWWTVGPVGAGAMLAALVLHWAVLPGRQVLSTCAVAAMAMTPLMWFAGSSLPLYPSVPRIQDNLPVHTVAGIAVWLLFVAALVDVAERQRESR